MPRIIKNYNNYSEIWLNEEYNNSLRIHPYSKSLYNIKFNNIQHQIKIEQNTK